MLIWQEYLTISEGRILSKVEQWRAEGQTERSQNNYNQKYSSGS